MSGVIVSVRPGSRVALPVGRRRGPRRVSAGQGTTKWVLGVGVLAVVLAAGTTATVATVAAAPAPPPTVSCSAGGAAGLSPEQLANAAWIVATGQALGVPQRGQVIAVAVAMQESTLWMYANDTVPASLQVPHQKVGRDYDSVGLFQQRPGWGSVAERMDPATSAKLFYRHLLALPGWEQLPVTVAAQTVQVSAYPNAYAKWENLATQLVTGTTCTKK